jgi:hypothetical protein
MTEYEIAALAAYDTELYYGLASLLQEQVNLVLETSNLFYSLLFGYVIAAYVVGKKLTKSQVVTLSLLYLLAVIYNRIVATAFLLQGVNLADQLEEMGFPVVNPISFEGVIAITVTASIAVLASLYFMWSIRHPSDSKTQIVGEQDLRS